MCWIINSVCQSHSVATDPMLCGTNFSFFPKGFGVAIDRLNPGTGFDSLHTSCIKSSKRCYRNLLCKFYNTLISHTHISHNMPKGHIRPTVKKSSGNKADSKNFRPVMNSSNFLKALEYLLLPHLEKHVPDPENYFAY